MERLRDLAAPSSGQQELKFRRFLLKCYQKTENPSSGEWKRDPVFHKYVEGLQEQLANLRNNSTIQLPAGCIEEYVRCVEHLASSLLTPSIPLYCRRLPRIEQGTQTRITPTLKVNKEGKSQGYTPVYKDFRHLLRDSQFGSATKEKLDMHSQIQENLTDNMAVLAKALKDRSKIMASAIQERDSAMDSVTDALEYSVAGAKQASKNAKRSLKQSRMGTCRMLMILFFMGLVFTAMVIFIRVTSLMGYKVTNNRNSEL